MHFGVGVGGVGERLLHGPSEGTDCTRECANGSESEPAVFYQEREVGYVSSHK